MKKGRNQQTCPGSDLLISRVFGFAHFSFEPDEMLVSSFTERRSQVRGWRWRLCDVVMVERQQESVLVC